MRFEVVFSKYILYLNTCLRLRLYSGELPLVDDRAGDGAFDGDAGGTKRWMGIARLSGAVVADRACTTSGGGATLTAPAAGTAYLVSRRCMSSDARDDRRSGDSRTGALY